MSTNFGEDFVSLFGTWETKSNLGFGREKMVSNKFENYLKCLNQ